jgi:hypothetical protein
VSERISAQTSARLPWSLRANSLSHVNASLKIHEVGAVVETAPPAGSPAQAAFSPQNTQEPFQSRFLNYKRSYETTEERPADDQCFHFKAFSPLSRQFDRQGGPAA